MAEKLIFDTGIKEFDVNGNGLLRFNPSDPNLYNRFTSVHSEVEAIESDIQQRRTEELTSEAVLEMMADYDRRVKEKLSYVFGPENDFDKLLGGVNLMAMTTSGNLVVTNLLNALSPIIEDGVKQYAKMEAAREVAAMSE